MFMFMKYLFLLIASFIAIMLHAQSSKKHKHLLVIDSLYIEEVQKPESDKVLHAEPLYIDLIRDLGARKGEQEWNVGVGLTDFNTYDEYTALVEYEFAPVNRMGFEIELPFSFYYPNAKGVPRDSVPSSRLNCLKLATQYSFFVSEKAKLSMAIGYINELEFPTFNNYFKKEGAMGNVYNPFFVLGKRWGQNFHTLLYTGPLVHHELRTNHVSVDHQINTNLHYMIKGTRNFVGVEFNKSIKKNDFDMTVRPQLRLSMADNMILGIVVGVPIEREKERFSGFLRWIYEPSHSHKFNHKTKPLH